MTSTTPNLLQGRTFRAMEAVSPAPAGGSASRSRASRHKGLPAGLSGAELERWRLNASAAELDAWHWPPGQEGPHRWVIDRTLAWFARFRRLTVWYERRLDILCAFRL